jgi:hypothetical protein
MFVKSLLIVALALSAAGCIGDPLAALAPPEPDVSVERASWESAPAGCEDADAPGLKVATCDGEPLLGALVDGQGEVHCVDALSLLQAELGPTEPFDPRAGDPSPQPNHPRPPELVP